VSDESSLPEDPQPPEGAVSHSPLNQLPDLPPAPAPASPQVGDSCYFLFSSNQRPQYEQDIIDVLAAPTGSPYRFRYAERYIERAVRDKPPEVGSRVLVVFSIQQKAGYHEPAYIPVRFGTVKSATWYGNFLVVDFLLADACCAPIRERSEAPRKERDAATRQTVVDFTNFIHQSAVSPKDGKSLSVGSLPEGQVNRGENEEKKMEVFQNLAELLQRTSSFAGTRFLRFEKMTERGTDTIVPSDENGYTVQAGKVYDLWFQQWQPREILTVEKFHVSVDGQNIKLIGSDVIEIASMYDVVSVPVFATSASTNEKRYSVIAVDPVDPTPGVSGPRIRIPVIITVPTARTTAVATASSIGAILLGLPALLPQAPMALKLLSVGTSALILALLSAYGFRR